VGFIFSGSSSGDNDSNNTIKIVIDIVV